MNRTLLASLAVSAGLHGVLLLRSPIAQPEVSEPVRVDLVKLPPQVRQRGFRANGVKATAGPSAPAAPVADEKARAQAESESDRLSPLTAKQVLFLSYFDRIREKLEAVWFPCVRACKAQVRGTAFAAVRLIFDDAGRLLLRIPLTTSGITCLDRCVDRATDNLESATVPHPPKGLIDADGRARVTWTFTIY